MKEAPSSDPVSKRRGNPPLPNAIYNERYLARLRKRTIIDDKGCFVWQGPVTSKGYIMLTHRQWRVQAHRVVYKIINNVELPTEQFVCHRCDNRRCWNHNHLFLGTAQVNNRDCGNKGRHHNGVKTHCKRGHEFTVENTYLKVTPTTVMRACKECGRIKMREEWRNGKAKARQLRYREKIRAQKMGASQ